MGTKKSSGSYYREASGRLEGLALEKGRLGEIAAAYREYICGGYLLRQPGYLRLVDTLMKPNPGSLSDMYEQGVRSFVEGVTKDKALADHVGRCVARLQLYPYAPSPYRRSFRSSSMQAYIRQFVQLMGCVFLPREFFDLSGQIFQRTAKRKTKGWDYGDAPEEVRGLGEFLVGNLVALALDDGDESVLEGIRGVCLEEDNEKGMDPTLLCGMLKSARQDMYDLLQRRILEGKWRHRILAVGDHGRLEAQMQMMTCVLDHDLLGDELVRRGVTVWMGLGHTVLDGHKLENLAALALAYACDPVARREVPWDETEPLFARLWAMSLYDVEDVVPVLRDLIVSDRKSQKLTALSFTTQLDHKPVQMDLGCCGLENMPKANMTDMIDGDLDILCLSMANFDIAYMAPMGSREGVQGISRSVEALRRAEARTRYFEALAALPAGVPAEGYRLEGEFFRGSLSRECVYANLFLIAAWDFDVGKVETLMEMMAECEAEIRRKFVDLFIGMPRTLKEREFLFTCLNDKSMSVRLLAATRLEDMVRTGGKEGKELGCARGELTIPERTALMNLLALKSVEMRAAGLTILLHQAPEAALGCARELCGDKKESKRVAGLEMLLQLAMYGCTGEGYQPQGTLYKGRGEGVPRGDAVQNVAAAVREAIEAAPPEKRSAREQGLIQRLQSRHGNENSPENGLGLFDPRYRPDLSDRVMGRASVQGIEDISGKLSGVKRKRMMGLLAAMCAKVEAHKDFTFVRVNYDLTEEETRLGSLTYLVRPHTTALKKEGTYTLDDFVLPEVWRAWRRENRVTLGEVLAVSLAYRMSEGSEPKRLPQVDKVLDQEFPLGVARECAKEFSERAYGLLSMAIIEKFIYEFAPEDIFAVLQDVMVGLLRKVPAPMWGQGVYLNSEAGDRERHEDVCLADVKEIEFVLDLMEEGLGEKNVSEGFFLEYAALCIYLGQVSGRPCVRLTAKHMAKAVVERLVKPDLLYQYLCVKGLKEAMEILRAPETRRIQGGQNTHDDQAIQANQEIQVVQIAQETQEIQGIQEVKEIQGVQDIQDLRDPAQSHEISLLEQVVKTLSARVIEIELGRGDSATPVSHLAMEITYHEGVHAFVGILAALAGETLDDGGGDGDACPSQLTRKVVLSSLLRASSPGTEDNAHSLCQVLQAAESKVNTFTPEVDEGTPKTDEVTLGEGRAITEKRLLEAAMYVPAWAPIIAEYLAWPGFLRAIEFLRIHTMDDLSDRDLFALSRQVASNQITAKLKDISCRLYSDKDLSGQDLSDKELLDKELSGKGFSDQELPDTELSDEELCNQVGPGQALSDNINSCVTGVRVTLLSAQEIREGVFDIGWLRSVCQTMGEERFLKLLYAAKCNADIGRYSRLRLFVEAGLNRIPVEELYRDISVKRRKDKMICLGLVPLQKEAMADALRRFEFIQEFFKQSQSLSAGRRAREKKACAIALRNLAVNANFSDVSRFIWHMEHLRGRYA
ncbi:MAG: DUF5724 domain-containing protein [Peptococcaceae bacterium]|nr:DUF5724 domain-containing protein [Peptococcaceae bacterium]